MTPIAPRWPSVPWHMLQHMYDEAGFARTRWLDRVEYDRTVPGRAELEAMRRSVAM